MSVSRRGFVSWMVGSALATAMGSTMVGCRGGASPPKLDATLARYTTAGREAFAEGDVESATVEYRAAIRRAWAIDEPYESGTNAYNLAACLISAGQNARARDWLLDARAELCRANRSVANVWLLEAKIAQDEGRLADATMLIDRASCARPPCGDECNDAPSGCGCCDDDPCQESCLTKIPCVGTRLQAKEATRQCEDDFEAQVHLARARVAAEIGDVPDAMCHFRLACELAAGVCSEELQAELQSVAAMIHLAKNEYLAAAIHFDKEALHLRRAKNYRLIPTALELAAAAYAEAGRPRLSVERSLRVARIWFGRGDVRKAWRLVNRTSQMVDLAGCDSISVRLALVADEIQQSLGEVEPITNELIDDSLEEPFGERLEEPQNDGML